MRYWAGYFFGFVAGGLLAFAHTSWSFKSDLINRGMAQYCPDTGEWAFKGECEG